VVGAGLVMVGAAAAVAEAGGHCLSKRGCWRVAVPACLSCSHTRVGCWDRGDEAHSRPLPARCAVARSLPGPVDNIQHRVADVQPLREQHRVLYQDF
jgi:hypothetical protein